MWETVITAIVSVVTGGGLVVLVTLRAKKDAATAETDKIEMDNFRTGTALLNEQIIEPLKKELASTRREVIASRKECARLRKAINAINRCPHAASCPVTVEMSSMGDDSEPRD